MAIQGLSAADAAAAGIMARGWADHLPEYLYRRWAQEYDGLTPAEIEKAIQDFLRDPGRSKERDWLQSAVDGLDFIGDNARWPYVEVGTPDGATTAEKILDDVILAAVDIGVGAASAGAGIALTVGELAVSIYGDASSPGAPPGASVDQSIDNGVVKVADQATDAWLQWLASKGYFSKEAMAAWKGDPHYADPYLTGTNGTPAVVQLDDGTGVIDPQSQSAQDWLAVTQFDKVGQGAVDDVQLQNPLDSDAADPGQTSGSHDKQVTLP